MSESCAVKKLSPWSSTDMGWFCEIKHRKSEWVEAITFRAKNKIITLHGRFLCYEHTVTNETKFEAYEITDVDVEEIK